MPEFSWNQQRRRYLTPRGREVSPERLRGFVEQAKEAARERMRADAEAYRSGEINRAEFFVRLNREIARGHAAAAMAAAGGREQMTPKLWGRVGQMVAQERRYSRTFHAEMLDVDPADFPAWRAAKYADNIGKTYDNILLARESAAGAKIERVLGSSERHCGTCPGKAGIYDAGEAPPLGDDECGPGCNCYFREVEEAVAA